MSKILEVEGTWVYKSKEYPGKLYYDSDYPIHLVININEYKFPKENSSDSWVSENNDLSKTILISKWNLSKSFEGDLTTIICDSVVVGENLSGTFFKDNKFSKLEISFDCVSDWIEAERYNITKFSDLVPYDFPWDKEKYHVKISLKQIEEIEKVSFKKYFLNLLTKKQPTEILNFESSKNNAEVKELFGTGCEIAIQKNNSKYPFHHLFYNNHYIISVCPTTEQSHFWFEKVVNSLKDMFILISGRLISITYFKLSILQNDSSSKGDFYILFSPETPIINNTQKDVVCPYMQIDSFDAFINCWFTVYNTKLIVPIKTFTSLEFNNNVYEEIKFLSYMQALESYFNYKFKDMLIISESQFNKFCSNFKKYFINIYYNKPDDDYVKLFINKLNDVKPQINKYNLKDKIYKFIDTSYLNDHFSYDNYSFHYIVEKLKVTKDTFIRKIINLRNNLTHHFSDNKPSDYLNMYELSLINAFLVRIIIMFLFLELGFDSDTASWLMEEYKPNQFDILQKIRSLYTSSS